MSAPNEVLFDALLKKALAEVNCTEAAIATGDFLNLSLVNRLEPAIKSLWHKAEIEKKGPTLSITFEAQYLIAKEISPTPIPITA